MRWRRPNNLNFPLTDCLSVCLKLNDDNIIEKQKESSDQSASSWHEIWRGEHKYSMHDSIMCNRWATVHGYVWSCWRGKRVDYDSVGNVGRDGAVRWTAVNGFNEGRSYFSHPRAPRWCAPTSGYSLFTFLSSLFFKSVVNMVVEQW